MTPSRAGLPMGLQVIGPEGADDDLCRFGLQFETAQPWAGRWPKLIPQGKTE
jgi:Asp-tRNA(Asn)/Glu-tRNA(Gln) amidotransferase A subunit family amidase